MNKKRLIVIGNGMAGARVVEEVLKRAPDMFDITMFGAEPYGNYNRILLSNVLNGTDNATDIFMNPLSWYAENKIGATLPPLWGSGDAYHIHATGWRDIGRSTRTQTLAVWHRRI